MGGSGGDYKPPNQPLAPHQTGSAALSPQSPQYYADNNSPGDPTSGDSTASGAYGTQRSSSPESAAQTYSREHAGQRSDQGPLSTPGYGEQYYQQNQGKYGQPTMSSQFWQQNQGTFGQPGQAENYARQAVAQYGAGRNPQNSLGAYQAFQADKPNIKTDPGLDPYYQNANRQANEQINRQMAARGAWGSSAAADMTSEAATNLAADRAKNEAQYNLQRLGEQRNWDQLGGSLAGQADANQLSWTQGLGQLANQGQAAGLARMGLGGTMAGQADATNLNYLNSGMNAASQAQGLGENRYQNMFNNEMGYGSALSGLMGHNYDQLLGQDYGLLNDQLGMGTAAASQGRDIAHQQDKDSQNSVLSLFKAFG